MKGKGWGINRDKRLCVIVGTGGDTLRTAEAALQGGAGVVQYRGKKKPGAVQYREVSALRRLTLRYGADLIINDRPDLVLLADADGIHLGAEDLPVPVARRILGPKKKIGATAHCLREAEQAEQQGADYVGFGAVFATGSKEGVPVAGLGAVAEAVSRVDIPVIGIGGISRLNITDVFEAGAAGVAVLSAVGEAADPASAARELLAGIELWDRGCADAGKGVPFTRDGRPPLC